MKVQGMSVIHWNFFVCFCERIFILLLKEMRHVVTGIYMCVRLCVYYVCEGI